MKLGSGRQPFTQRWRDEIFEIVMKRDTETTFKRLFCQRIYFHILPKKTSLKIFPGPSQGNEDAGTKSNRTRGDLLTSKSKKSHMALNCYIWVHVSWLPYSTYLYLDFHLFHDKAKRTQQGNLLGTCGMLAHGAYFALIVRYHNPNLIGYWTFQHAVIVINNCIYFHFQFCFLQVVDIPNEIAKSGHIYFPEFCKLVLDRFRQIIIILKLVWIKHTGEAAQKTTCFGKICSRFLWKKSFIENT